MGFGKIFGQSWNDYKRNFKSIFWLVFWFILVPSLIVSLIGPIWGSFDETVRNFLTMEIDPATGSINFASLASYTILSFILGIVLIGLTVFVLGSMFSSSLNKKVSFSEMRSIGAKVFWGFFAFEIVTLLFLLGLFILLSLP